MTAAAASTRRRGPWFELVLALLAAGVALVVITALTRHVGRPGTAVLPESWARGDRDGPTRPLLGRALLTSWQVDPAALVVTGVILALYGLGVACLRARGQRWPAHRSAAFAAGAAVLVLATCSSVGVYDMVLFSAHMVGHLMLIMVAPVLLCAGHPFTLLADAPGVRWRARMRWLLRSRVVTAVFAPPVALACYAAALVGTHLTVLMNVIMQRIWAGQLEHLVFVLVGVQLFTLVVAHEPIRWNLTTPLRWLLLAVAMAVDTFTGVVLLMATVPVAMGGSPMTGMESMTMSSLGVDALSDTRTGGAIMWVGGDGLMALIMIALARQWLRSPELRRRDRLGAVETVRQTAFAARTGTVGGETDPDFDDDEVQRERYNHWLASLDHR